MCLLRAALVSSKPNWHIVLCQWGEKECGPNELAFRQNLAIVFSGC